MRTTDKQSNISLLVVKSIILAFPIIILIFVYLLMDPFKVIYKYPCFYVSGRPAYVSLNRDYVSMETLLSHYPKYNYDSFIFGNSCSIFYEVNDWQKHITSKKCFHFDASVESIFGLYSKIKFLNAEKIPIRNALIIMDYSTLVNKADSSGHLYIKHPMFSGKSWYSFQMEFLREFFDINFLVSYVDFKLSGKIKKYMLSVLDDRPINYDIESNEIKFTNYENMINRKADDYYLPRTSLFRNRDGVNIYSPAAIGNEQKRMLKGIMDIFKNDNTKYKIIISPLFDQKKLNTADLKVLNTIFGIEQVFDYSGINELTNNIRNYYDNTHYRPHVTRLIMSEIYTKYSK